MKTARPLARRIGLVLVALASIASLSTCDDFFGTEDLKERIQEDVALANAESVSFTINATPSSGGTLSMSGAQTKKVGESFSITATVFDAYVFGGWSSSGGGEVTFSYPNESDETTTVATIGAASDDVVITANFVARPYVKTVTPSEGNTVVKNQPIIANFSKPMDPDAFSLPGRVTVTYDGINPTTANPKTIYASGSSSSYFTVGITSTRLTLTPTGSFMPANSTITILISNDVTDSEGTTMAESKEWYFYTNNVTDTSEPVIDGITILNGSSASDEARTFTSGSTYHAVKSSTVTLEIAASTTSASSSVQSMVLIESGNSGGTPTSRTTELGYTDSYTYTLATADDGPKTLTYYVRSSTGIDSAHESVNLYLDTAPPTLSLGAISSNNGTNSAFAVNGNTVSLGFSAADASGSGLYSTVGTIAGQTASVPSLSGAMPASAPVVVGSTEGPLSYSMTVTDIAGNTVTMNSGATGSVTVDRTPPTVDVATTGNKTIGKNGETISFTATFVDANGIDETMAPRLIIGGSPHTMTRSTNLVWTYDYPVPTGDSAPSFAVAIDATDVAGNDNAASTGVQSVIVDNTRPTVTAGATTVSGVAANAGYAREGSVITIPLTITEASTGVATKPTVTLTEADGTLIATMTVSTPSGSGPTYTCNATHTLASGDAEGLLHYAISGTTDGAGNVMTATGPTSTGRTYDRSLPTASYIYLGSDTNPGATYTTTGTPAVYSDAADGNGVYAQFSYDNGSSWTPASPAAFTSGSTAVDLTSGDQGPRAVQMKVFDAAGNQKALAVSDSVIFDSIKPVASVTGVTVSAGNAGYAIEGSVITLTLSIAENTSGMKTAPSASIRNESDALIAAMAVSGPTGTGPYVYTASYTMDGDDPEVALYYKVSGAEDNAGNVMTAGNLVSLGRTYDRTVPAPDITAPAAAAYVNADATMTVSADGGTLTAQIGTNTASSYASGSTKLSALAGWSAIAEDGDVAITVYSTDAAGNIGTATRTFKKDTVKPTASVTGVTVSAGNAGYAIEGSVITLTISIAENTSGMKTAPSASIRNESDALIAAMAVSGPTGTGPYVYTASYTMDDDDAEVALYYKVSGAEDNAGNVMTAGNLVTLDRTYDRTVPAPDITAPAAVAYVNADATMTISADGGTLTAQIGTNTASAYASGSTKISALAGWSAIAEDGDVAVTVYSTDAAGNVGDATRTFKKDTTRPTITAGSCSYTAPNESKSTVTVVADGTGSAIAYYRFSGAVAAATTEFSSQPCEITLTGSSPYSVTITVEDQAGNTSSGTTISITDGSAGTFSISSPAGTTAARRSTTIGSSASSAVTTTTATSYRPASRVTSTPATIAPEAKSASWVTPKPAATGASAPPAAQATAGVARTTAARAAVSSRSETAKAKAPAITNTAADEPEMTAPATEAKHSTAQPSGTAPSAASAPSGASAAPSTSDSSSPSGAPTAPDAPRAPDGTGDRMPTQAIMPEAGRDGRRDEKAEDDA